MSYALLYYLLYDNFEDGGDMRRPFGMGYIIVNRHGRLVLDTLRSNRADSWAALAISLDHATPQDRRRERDRLKSIGFRCLFVIVEESVSAQNSRNRALAFIEKHFNTPINYSASMEDALIKLIRGEE